MRERSSPTWLNAGGARDREESAEFVRSRQQRTRARQSKAGPLRDGAARGEERYRCKAERRRGASVRDGSARRRSEERPLVRDAAKRALCETEQRRGSSARLRCEERSRGRSGEEAPVRDGAAKRASVRAYQCKEAPVRDGAAKRRRRGLCARRIGCKGGSARRDGEESSSSRRSGARRSSERAH